MSATTTISSKGQIVVPYAIRQQLGIQPSDVFVVSVDNNAIVVKKVATASDFSGKFPAKKVLSEQEIAKIVKSRVRTKHSGKV
jgi:AbrB family looped-hinge helix DNA binding protein